MAASIFTDKENIPTEEMLVKELGETSKIWKEIKEYLSAEYGELREEWKFYNQKSGWILKTLKKKRNLFFFIPHKNYFTISFVFGDKAVAEIEKSDLPEEIIISLQKARKYAEGRGVRIEVHAPEQSSSIKQLVKFKLNN